MHDEVKPGRYQHWKGGFYRVIDIVKNSDDPTDVAVLYQSEEDGSYWRRRIDEFYGTTNGVPRFVKVADIVIPSLLPPQKITDIARRISTMFVTLTGQLQLCKAVPETCYYEFRDTEFHGGQVYAVSGLNHIAQGFLSFARDKLSGKLDGLEIDDLVDVEGYDPYVFEALVQYILFGKLMNA